MTVAKARGLAVGADALRRSLCVRIESMTRRDLVSLLALPATLAGQAPARSASVDSLTTIDTDGTVHITRAIPVPKTVSAEAYAKLVTGESWAPDEGSKEAAELIEKMRLAYPVNIEQTTVGGVKAKIVTPASATPNKKDRVLICLHGGGFRTDSGSFIEAIPIASLTGTRVISWSTGSGRNSRFLPR
jgi:epsilon-lactone hydrolase